MFTCRKSLRSSVGTPSLTALMLLRASAAVLNGRKEDRDTTD